MQRSLVVSSSPHLRNERVSTRGLMTDVVIALLPAAIASVWFFGGSALMLMLVATATAVLTEFLYQKMTGQRVTVGDMSAVVTGLLLAFNLPASAPWWLAVIGSVIAILLVKQIFGGVGNNFVNPALAARTILMLSWTTLMAARVLPHAGVWVAPEVADAIASVTPLGEKAASYSLWQLFAGDVPGMGTKVLVYADPDLIHQVAYNLLDNAIKFTPAGGTIRFGVERLGPEVEVSIWNSGQGISPEALPYVFQRFYKEDQSRGLHARGAGLGLNICKVLVNLSGGQIRVESKQGEWCRFVFTLPVQPPNPGGMKRLPDESGRPGAVEDPASMKPVD